MMDVITECKPVEVEIIRVSHPGEFYLRFKSDLPHYQGLKDKLRQLYGVSNSDNKVIVSSPMSTGLPMYVIQEGYAYRRCVLRDNSIFLVDEGRIYDREGTVVFYKAPTFIKLIPPFCILCHLPRASRDPQSYSEESISLFKEQFEASSLVNITAMFPKLYIDNPNPWYNSLPVDILLHETYSSPVTSSLESKTSLQSRCEVFKIIHRNDDEIDGIPDNLSEMTDEPIMENATPIKSWKRSWIPSEPGPHLARVTNVDCYGQIYLHLKSRIGEFRDVRSSCTMEGKLNDSPGPEHAWEVGDACLANFDDDLFYRGIIIGLESQVAQVLYVDYGNLKEVKLRDLKIPYTCGDIPMLSLRVVADHVVPAEEGCGNKWPQSVLEDLYCTMFYGNKKRVVRFTLLPGHRGLPLPVFLEIYIGDKWVSLTEVLIGSGNGRVGDPLPREQVKIMNDYVGNIEAIYELFDEESADEEALDSKMH